jgi:hypothetical protein
MGQFFKWHKRGLKVWGGLAGEKRREYLLESDNNNNAGREEAGRGNKYSFVHHDGNGCLAERRSGFAGRTTNEGDLPAAARHHEFHEEVIRNATSGKT